MNYARITSHNLHMSNDLSLAFARGSDMPTVLCIVGANVPKGYR